MKTEIIQNQKIKCYDNGGKSLDRYTVIYLDRQVKSYAPLAKIYEALSLSENPTHSNGFHQYIQTVLGAHLGKRIAFADLPTNCQSVIFSK